MHAVGLSRGVSDKVMLAGFEAGWVESHMNNLACGDADSLGVFQQRPSMGWGTPDQIMNVTYAAGRFFELAVRMDREHLSPGLLADAVQRSCCPERYDQAFERASTMLRQAWQGGPEVVGGVVHVVQDGDVWADGVRLTTSQDFVGRPSVAGGVVYARTARGEVRALVGGTSRVMASGVAGDPEAVLRPDGTVELYAILADGSVAKLSDLPAMIGMGTASPQGARQSVSIPRRNATGVPSTDAASAPSQYTANEPSRQQASVPNEHVAGVPDERAASVLDERAAGVSNERATGVPDERTAGVPDERAAGVPNGQVVGTQDHRVPDASAATAPSRHELSAQNRQRTSNPVWQPLSPPAFATGKPSVITYPDGTAAVYVRSGDGDKLMATAAGTWREIANGLEASPEAVLRLDGTVGVYALKDGRPHRLTTTWEPLAEGRFIDTVSAQPDGTVYARTAEGKVVKAG
ncbi:hypothetical protein ACQEU1_33700 [Lentzea sp. CA-135723]